LASLRNDPDRKVRRQVWRVLAAYRRGGRVKVQMPHAAAMVVGLGAPSVASAQDCFTAVSDPPLARA
jgi:hypothetical protein